MAPWRLIGKRDNVGYTTLTDNTPDSTTRQYKFTVLNLSILKKSPQPNHNRTKPTLNILQYLRTLHIVWGHRETPSYSASHQAPNYVQRS